MFYSDSYLAGLQSCVDKIKGLDRFSGKSVLVTGASGLVGSALADVLLQANSTLGLDCNLYLAGREEERLRLRFAHWGNDTWRFACYDNNKPIQFPFHSDYIFHCASNAHPLLYSEQPVETLVGNVVGTNSILRYAKECGATRVLYVSSSEVYGPRNGLVPYVESDQFPVEMISSRSCYPISKRACETLCASFYSEYCIDFVIARPGHVWGPTCTASDSRAHAQFAREAAARRNVVMKSPGLQLRSYIYSTDCAGALLTICIQGETGGSYNVGVPGFSCTIRDLAETLARAGGVRVVHDFPSEGELAGYNPMSCSALNCEKLAKLDFSASYSLINAANETIECLRGDAA